MSYVIDARWHIIARSFNGDVLITIKVDTRWAVATSKELALKSLIPIQRSQPVLSPAPLAPTGHSPSIAASTAVVISIRARISLSAWVVTSCPRLQWN